MSLFDIDDDGWIEQNQGRPAWELVREAVQNALDTESDISVKVNTRKRQVVVKDFGDGFSDMSDAYTVFGGDKGDDPTKRGRFGRGLKEVVAGAEIVRVFSTGGSIEFNVKDRERIDLGREISQGTKVLIENSDWSKEDMEEVKKYLFKIWPPANQKVMLNLHGGGNDQHERWEPEWVQSMRMQTVKYEDGRRKTPYRRTDVHIKRAEDGKGRLYEMGIPILLDADFPYWVDVQQKVPMAEQRNEPDSSWLSNFKPKLLNVVYEDLSEKELRADWVQSQLDSFAVNEEVKEHFFTEVVRDKSKAGTVLQSDDESDDKARNYGYQVVNPENFGTSAASALRDVAQTSTSLAKEMHERNETEQEPTPEQEEFIGFAEDVAEELGYEELEFETWLIEPSYEGHYPTADHHRGVIRLNTFASDWDEISTHTLGTLIHEISHEEGEGHNEEWYSAMQENFAELLVKHADLSME